MWKFTSKVDQCKIVDMNSVNVVDLDQVYNIASDIISEIEEARSKVIEEEKEKLKQELYEKSCIDPSDIKYELLENKSTALTILIIEYRIVKKNDSWITNIVNRGWLCIDYPMNDPFSIQIGKKVERDLRGE